MHLGRNGIRKRAYEPGIPLTKQTDGAVQVIVGSSSGEHAGRPSYASWQREHKDIWSGKSMYAARYRSGLRKITSEQIELIELDCVNGQDRTTQASQR